MAADAQLAMVRRGRRGPPLSIGTRCADCVFWRRPDGGLNPVNRGDMPMAWWARAGICARHAPRPSASLGLAPSGARPWTRTVAPRASRASLTRRHRSRAPRGETHLSSVHPCKMQSSTCRICTTNANRFNLRICAVAITRVAIAIASSGSRASPFGRVAAEAASASAKRRSRSVAADLAIGSGMEPPRRQPCRLRAVTARGLDDADRCAPCAGRLSRRSRPIRTARATRTGSAATSTIATRAASAAIRADVRQLASDRRSAASCADRRDARVRTGCGCRLSGPIPACAPLSPSR